MSTRPEPAPAGAQPSVVPVTTVEQLVRTRLAEALGGRRGLVEGALPTLAFTLVYLPTHRLRFALVVGMGTALALLLARVLARQTVQFALNSVLVMTVAAAAAARTGRAQDVFLPGILWNAGALLVLLLSILTRWPFVGLLLGSATGDLSGWRREPAVLRLCTRLTWLFLLPNVLRLAVQLPLYLAGHVGWLAATKLALGWPPYVGVLALMAWMLARGSTPLPADETPLRDPPPR